MAVCVVRRVRCGGCGAVGLVRTVFVVCWPLPYVSPFRISRQSMSDWQQALDGLAVDAESSHSHGEEPILNGWDDALQTMMAEDDGSGGDSPSELDGSHDGHESRGGELDCNLAPAVQGRSGQQLLQQIIGFDRLSRTVPDENLDPDVVRVAKYFVCGKTHMANRSAEADRLGMSRKAVRR